LVFHISFASQSSSLLNHIGDHLLTLHYPLDNLESIVMDQLSVDEFGYEDDQGIVEGEEVIADVIEQGTALARERNVKNQNSDAGWPGEELITHSYLN
jgi:hypothetical protein